MNRAVFATRKIDALGRIVLPVELRKRQNITENEEIDIFLNIDGDIVLRKSHPHCTFCESTESLQQINGKFICRSCGQKIIAGCEKKIQAPDGE